MRQPLVAGNWKMNGSRSSIQSLVKGILAGLGEGEHAEVAVCPPFVYISEVATLLQGRRVHWGGQNLSQESAGAFTGEVAGPMLKDLGCHFVIVGHSERRALYNETDTVVAQKFEAALGAGLVPILCVGELLEEREAGDTEAVIGRQLDAVLGTPSGIAGFSKAVIAYEPVWAIGTGRTATPDQAQEVHAFIRRRLIEQDAEVGNACRILYGGSVKGGNARELFAMPDIDGGLIGGASLNAEEFLTICRAAA